MALGCLRGGWPLNWLASALAGARGSFAEYTMTVGQNQWDPMVGAPPILVYFSGDWDVHWAYGLLTHDQMRSIETPQQVCRVGPLIS